MESIATLADGSLNKWIEDSVPLSEVYLSVYTKPFTESLSISEVYKSSDISSSILFNLFVLTIWLDNYVDDL